MEVFDKVVRNLHLLRDSFGYYCPECKKLVEGTRETYDVNGEVSVMIYCEDCGRLLREYLIPKKGFPSYSSLLRIKVIEDHNPKQFELNCRTSLKSTYP